MQLLIYTLGTALFLYLIIIAFRWIENRLNTEDVKQIDFPDDMDPDRRMRMVDTYLSTFAEGTTIRDYYLKVGGHYYIYKDALPDKHEMALSDHILINYYTSTKAKDTANLQKK